LKAIISDIHGNLEALRAVLEDIASKDIGDIVCLGDVVGYGPNPIECLEIAGRKFAACIRGNHEEATLSEPVEFNTKAEEAIRWTHDVIEQLPPGQRSEILAFLTKLPDTIRDGVVFVHGTPAQPTRDYLFPQDVRQKERMAAIFALVDTHCFVGHSHIPGVFTEGGYQHPSEMLMEGIYMLDQGKSIINVGSVGQPRDKDPRACYCTYDGDTVVFRRVRYDVRATVRKIYANRHLHNSLGDRLSEGR